VKGGEAGLQQVEATMKATVGSIMERPEFLMPAILKPCQF
jgi:hypothetical protein